MRERKQCFSAQKVMFYDSQSVGLFLEELKELKEISLRSPFGQGVKADSPVDVFLSRNYWLTSKAK